MTGAERNQASTDHGVDGVGSKARIINAQGVADPLGYDRPYHPTTKLEASAEADFAAQGDVLSIAGFAGGWIADYRFGNVLAA
jgi:hypothetical protein